MNKEDLRRCSKCLKNLPIETFQLRMDRGKVRRREVCPECHRKESREWRKENGYVKQRDRVLSFDELAEICQRLGENRVIPKYGRSGTDLSTVPRSL